MTPPQFQAKDYRRIALAERRRLHHTLQGLTQTQWDTPSLCAGWTVRDVAGHVASNCSIGLGGFLASMARAGFDHDRHNERTARAWSQRPTRELLAGLEHDRIMPIFRATPALLLVDTVVHHLDIRRPLGMATRCPEEHLTATLQAIVTTKAFASEARRLDGMRVQATDLTWTHDAGAAAATPTTLRGPAETLILSVMGREPASEELDRA